VEVRREKAGAKRTAVIHMLVMDAALAEVVSALRGRGLGSVLLKGPAIAHWLYDNRLDRRYRDIDLLVDPDRFAEAGAVMAEQGFVEADTPSMPHHSVWDRPGTVPVRVELHRALYWTRCPDALVWSLLADDPDELVVADTRVPTLATPGRLLMVALHAAQHGRGFSQSLTDLELACRRAEASEWEHAAQLAGRLGALEPFGAGLRLHPLGARIADALRVPMTRSRELALLSATPPPTAMGFERLAMARGTRDRIRLVVEEVAPPPSFMWVWHPLARRGRLGLGLAYLWRPSWLLWKAPAGLRAWRRARTSARGPDAPAGGDHSR
jgi:hypothetical protein